ncbi:MAG TPA: NAD(P)/FAD-dependent oxidoreductase [bacterium]|nr:NAD(P)/FAD-dependent oxidoreductase [bacterium]
MILDALVVGSGPAGSAAAAVLAMRGCRVLVAERARFPRAKPCGDYLNPGCGIVLQRIGALAEVERAALPVPGMRIVAPDGASAATAFSAGGGYALPRHTLDHVLMAHAARRGAAVIEEARVTALEPGAHCLRVTVERGSGPVRRESYHARLVIGADGIRSEVARMIGAGNPPRSGRFTVGAYLRDLKPDAAPGEPLPGEIHFARDRYCGVAYLPGGLANVTIALSREVVRSWRGALAARYWEALHDFPRLADRLAEAGIVGGLRTTGPVTFWRRRTVARGTLLAGDAAAFIDPMTGQGVSLALRGGELAAEAAVRALDRGGPTRRTLAAYDRARGREFAGAVFLSRALEHLAFRPVVIQRAVRAMSARSDLATRFIDAVGGVGPALSVLHLGFLAGLAGIA